MTNTIKSLLTIVFIATSLQLLAGWEITYRNSDPSGTISYDVMLIEDNIIRYGSIDGGFIFNLESQEFTFIVDQSKSYWTGNIKDFREELNEAVKIVMDEMIKSLPESQREMVTQMLDGMADMYATPTSEQINAVNIEIDRTGEKQEIAGYDADLYLVKIDGILIESIWISDELDISDDMDSRKIAEMLNEISPNVEDEQYHEYTEEYLELWEKGFWMKSIDVDGEEVEAIKLIERNITDEELSPPADYTSLTPMELMQQQMMGGSNEDDGWE